MVAGISSRRICLMAAALMAAHAGPVAPLEAQARRREEPDDDVIRDAEVNASVMSPVALLPPPVRKAVTDRDAQALSAAEAKRARRNAKRAPSSPATSFSEGGI